MTTHWVGDNCPGGHHNDAPANAPSVPQDAAETPAPMSGPSEAELRAADEALERGGELYSAGWEAGKQWERENPARPAPPAGAAVAGDQGPPDCTSAFCGRSDPHKLTDSCPAYANWLEEQLLEARTALSAQRERIAGELEAKARNELRGGNNMAAAALMSIAKSTRASTAPAPAPEAAVPVSKLRALVAKWREIEGPVAEAKKGQSMRSFGFHWCRVWVWVMFWREPSLDPYAIGAGDALLEAAAELEALCAPAGGDTDE